MADKQQEQFQKILLDLLSQPENKDCADCGSKGPRWASASLGIFICIKCSGIHRSMGTHISFVRSVSLDKWTATQVKNMQNMGNGRAREIYEHFLPDNFRRPTENEAYPLEQFIRAKYERKEYMRKESSKSTPRQTRRPKAKKAEPTKVASNLISLGDEPTEEEWNFQGASQGASQGTSQRAFVSPPPVAATPLSTPSGASNDIFGNFTAATPTAEPQSFDMESAFFGSSTPSAPSPAPSTFGASDTSAKPSKASILQLYDTPQPASPFGTTSMANPATPTRGPNYNVALPGLGMPVAPVYPTPVGMQGNMGMYQANMGYNGNMGGYNGNTGYNGNMGMNMGMAPGMQNPNFVNTNGYVNAKWMSTNNGNM